jgi:hypothetical protein
MPSVTFNCDVKVLSEIDQVAQEREVSRSHFIVDVLRAYFAPREPSSYEVKLLENDLRHKDELLTLKEAEISDLKAQNGMLFQELHDARARLDQFLLPAPKSHWWSRLRRS